MIAPEPPAVPRRRTLAALLLTGAALGMSAGVIDRARGVGPAASRIFTNPRPTSVPAGPPAAAPATPRAGAAAFQETCQ